MVLYVIISFAAATVIIMALYLLSRAVLSPAKRPETNALLSRFCFPLLGVPAFITLYLLRPAGAGIDIFRTDSLFSPRNLMLLLTAVVPVAVLASLDKSEKMSFVPDVLSGMTMELIQRLFAQNLLFVLMFSFGVPHARTLGVVANAVLWTQLVFIREIITKHRLTRFVLPDAIASLIFSLSAGFLYVYSGNILLPVLAHGAERLASHALSSLRAGQER